MRKGEGGSGSYAVPLKPRTYIAIRSNQCTISVQSVYNQCPIREVSQSTPTISVSNQCPISVQSDTISVQSVYNQCTIS